MRYLFLALAFTIAPELLARNLYLNGTDITSARNQNLKNVNLRIDENGNIFVEAPHYQVNEETNFMPLSSWLQGANTPKHQPPQGLPDQMKKVGKLHKVDSAGEQNMPPEQPASPDSGLAGDQPKMQDKPGTSQPPR